MSDRKISTLNVKGKLNSVPRYLRSQNTSVRSSAAPLVDLIQYRDVLRESRPVPFNNRGCNLPVCISRAANARRDQRALSPSSLPFRLDHSFVLFPLHSDVIIKFISSDLRTTAHISIIITTRRILVDEFSRFTKASDLI